MQPERFVTCGLVLRETVTRDADKILTVLTPDRGRLSVIARGARRKGSRVAAACQLLAYSEMTLYEKGRWTMLDAADTIELFDGLRAGPDGPEPGGLLRRADGGGVRRAAAAMCCPCCSTPCMPSAP